MEPRPNNPMLDVSSPSKFYFLPGFEGLRLAVVGFLAILGEGSVLANAQVSSLSKLFFLPRLLPAPQAFLRPNRPSQLQPYTGYVTGVHSGNDRDYVNHIGHVVLDAESMPDYSVRCVEIVRKDGVNRIKMRTTGPLSALAIFGSMESAALLALSIYYNDGMALVATILLSFLSTLIGLGNKWKLQLVKKRVKSWTPPGDVVIRYPGGSFLVVKCTEDVARELYFAPENIQYLISHRQAYRLISLVGTIMLMFGVVALANAGLYLQLAFAASYILLNAAYWLVAALPPKTHWDTSSFVVKEQRLKRATPNTQHSGSQRTYVDYNETFTQALWKAIVATKDAEWVRRGEAAPQTPAWDEWLANAQAKANTAKYYYDKGSNTVVWNVPDWDPQQALADLIDKHKKPGYP